MSKKYIYFQNGELFIEDIKVNDFLKDLDSQGVSEEIEVSNKLIKFDVPSTPAIIYSREALRTNVERYLDGMKKHKIDGILGYALKANGNIHLLKEIKSFGVSALVTVSGYEIITGLKVGFLPQNIIFNGNGKQDWEMKLAVSEGVYLNVDSLFDAKRLVSISAMYPNKTIKVLLRIKPAPLQCTVSVHPYVNTSEASKFGFDVEKVDEVLDVLQESKNIHVSGIHCHLGSCIYDPGVYGYIASFVSEASGVLKNRGMKVELLDIGGGIGIDYERTIDGVSPFRLGDSPSFPDKNIPHVEDFLQIISRFVSPETKVLIEPGRSLVGNAGILLTKAIGIKEGNGKRFLVTDAAMTELIRPCLYSSHHQIYPTKLRMNAEWKTYDVVGPVCESSDFLGKNIELQEGSEYFVVMDVGAYGFSMSSTYNLRPKAAEFLASGTRVECIRRRHTFNDVVYEENQFERRATDEEK